VHDEFPDDDSLRVCSRIESALSQEDRQVLFAGRISYLRELAPTMSANSSRKPSVAAIAIVAVSAVVGSVVGSALVKSLLQMSGATTSAEQALAQASAEMNRNLPLMVDEFTRLDSTTALPDRKLLYKYTLVNLQTLPDPQTIINSVRPQALANYKQSAEMAELRRIETTLVYTYCDEQGAEVARFEIGPGDLE
jgi:hypothetical protein